MSLFNEAERKQLADFARLTYVNPFRPERHEVERSLLGKAWSMTDEVEEGRALSANTEALVEQLEALIETLRWRMSKRQRISAKVIADYHASVMFLLYHRHAEALDKLIEREQDGTPLRLPSQHWRKFREQVDVLCPPESHLAMPAEPAHYLACFYQLRRAYHSIFGRLFGRAAPLADLRAQVWEAIFTHDLERYQRVLTGRMQDVPVLITGPTGTGKELVARAIGTSTFIPFDANRLTFASEGSAHFYPVNLAALSSTLLESELFGHRRGSFTGAVADREGYLGACGQWGSVFLDEIGEVPEAVQVKLLRVLQERQFHRLGDTETVTFHGRILAATNRDLSLEIAEERFRQDFYYRLSASRIETPSLSRVLGESPEQLDASVRYQAERLVGGEEADSFAAAACQWIRRELGADYTWPGNYRELEQCLRSYLVHGSYQPARATVSGDYLERARGGELSLRELCEAYSKQEYSRHGSWETVAKVLDVDRRTARKYGATD